MTCFISCNDLEELDLREEHDMGSPSGSLLNVLDDHGQLSKKKFEDDLMKTLLDGNFEDIEKKITPRAFQNCKSNSLLIGMKVNHKLRGLADRMSPDAERFKQLANSVEEFTYCLLDPLKSDAGWCEQFGDHSLDDILDDAIEFEQKKFFTHPAVYSEMNRKWRGREFMTRTKWKSWRQLLFNIWCLFDLLFSPILLTVFSLLKRKWKVANVYLLYLKTPYHKFVRDTLSYIVLVALHYALCLSPLTIPFGGLEWAILVFFLGRCVVECKQIWGIKQRLKRSKEIRDDGAESSCHKTLSTYLR